MSMQPSRHCDGPHHVEAHVVYDAKRGGYRAQVRCPCSRVSWTSRRLARSFEGAAQAAQAAWEAAQAAAEMARITTA